MPYARIAGWGKYLPDKIVTNDDLGQIVETSDEWIRARTGIAERRIASDDQTAADLAVPAALEALALAEVPPADVDLVIVATSTPEYVYPACASLVQDRLGARRAGAFDVNAACSGFVYGLATAYGLIGVGGYRNVLVIGTEVYSRILDWTDRGTCVLFGDGAGAVLAQASDTPAGPLSIVLGSDGSGQQALYVPGICGRPAEDPGPGGYTVKMKGPEVYRFAVRVVAESTRQAVAQAGLSLDDIQLIVPHQANLRILKSVAKELRLPEERFYANLERYGNTSAASIPIALCEAVDEGRLRDGDHVVLVGFGGGLSWGAMALRWGVRPTAPQVERAAPSVAVRA